MPNSPLDHRISALLVDLEQCHDSADRTLMRQTLQLLRESLAQREDEFRHIDDRFRLAVNAAELGIWDWDQATGAITWNDHFARIAGTGDQMSAASFDSILQRIHPNDRAAVSDLITIARQQRKIFDHHFRVQLPGDAVRWVRARGGFHYNANGTAIRMTGTLVDITELVEGRRIAESEHRYRTLVENADAIITRIDRQYRHIFINRMIERATGLSPQDFLGKTNRQLGMPPELCDVWEAKMEQAFTTGQKVLLEFSFPSPDGIRHFESRLVPERDEAGNVVSLTSIAHDVTSLKQAVADAHDAHERLRLAAEVSGYGTFDFDCRTQEKYWSDNTRKHFGISLDAPVTHQTFYDGIHPDDRQRVRQIIDEAMRSGSNGAYRTEYRTIGIHDRQERWISAAGRVFFDDAGQPLRFIGATMDITAARRNANVLMDNEIAARAQRLADTMLHGVVHQDAAGTIIAMNPAAEHILGRTRQDLLGSTSERQEHHTTREDGTPFPGSEHPSMVALRTGEPVRGVVMGVYNPLRMERRWIRVTAVPIVPPGSSSPQEVYTVFEDITEQRHIENQLRLTNDRFELALRSSPVILFCQDLDLRYTWIHNPAFGHDAAAVAGKRDVDLFERAEDSAITEAIKREVIRTGKPQRQEVRVFGQGVDRFYDLLVDPQLDRDGRMIGVRCAAIDITDRKQIEQAREASETRLALGADVAGLALAEIDYATGVSHLSDAAAKLFGLGDQAISVPRTVVHATFHPDDRRELGRRIAESLQPDGPGWFAMDHRVVHPNGDVRWLRVRKQVFFEGQGSTRHPIRAMLAALDVSAEKQAAEAVRANEEFLRQVLDSLPEHVVVLDGRGQVIAVNEQWKRFAQGNGGDLRCLDVGVNYLDVCRASSAAGDPFAGQALAGLSSVLEGRTGTFSMEYPCDGPNSQRWFLMRARRLTGQADGLIISHVDITDRKRTEDAISQSEQRLRVALLNAPMSLYANDLNLRYTWIHNPRFGFVQQNMLGKKDEELLPLESVAPLIAMKHRVLASGVGERRHISTTINGANCTFDVTIEPQRDIAGQVVGLIVSTHDVTEMAEARAQAEAANRAKDHFLAVLSHELRTPLSPVLAATELLSVDTSLSPVAHDMVQMIRRNVELEARLIDDLLDVTRIVRDKLELHPTALDVHEKINQVITMCQADIHAKKLVLNVHFEAAEHHIHADAARFQQILWNLVKNAVKFTPDGGSIHVRTLNVAPGAIRIQITDTGVGIDPTAIPLIFKAFEQGGRDVTRRFGGLGLGLAISKALVHAHGGTISATSPGIGQGATFTLDMPMGAIANAGAQRHAAERSSLPACSVLLVEDHDDTRRSMVVLLTRMGCNVTSAATVAEALRHAAATAFDIVISDLGLPDATGFELMQQLKRLYPVKGIALSGYGMDQDLAKSKAAGFDVHLTKPVNLPALEQTLRQMMAARP